MKPNQAWLNRDKVQNQKGNNDSAQDNSYHKSRGSFYFP